MAIRSLASLGTSILTQALVLSPEVRASLPSLPSNQTYATPYVVSTGNLQQDIIRGAAQGIQVAQKPTFTNPTLLEAIKEVGLTFGKFYASSGSSLALTIAEQDRASRTARPTSFSLGRTNMGLFDDIWGGVQQATNAIFPADGSVSWGNILNTGVGLATQALTRNQPVTSSAVVPSSMAPAMSAAGAVARVGGTVARGFFNRFPNLATAVQTLRNSGMNVSRAKLYGVMKRFGPEFLVTGGLLTAAAVNELAVAGPGYRRMNPANVRALRKSVRRIESFHRLCKTTDRLRRKR